MPRPVITVEQRRVRLGQQHLLSAPVGGPIGSIADVADALVVLHATDPATLYLSVAARLPSATVASLDAELFEQRLAHRTLAMRRTLFVASRKAAPSVELSSSPKVAQQERRNLEKWLAGSGFAEPARWLDETFAEVLAAFQPPESGLSARELSARVERLTARILAGRGTKHPVEMPVSSRVLGLMAVEGLLVRGQPTGGWTDRQYRWYRRDQWWAEGDPSFGPERIVDEAEASTELVRCYLRRFGPVTLTDVVWWTGWTKTKTRQALADLDAREVELEPSGPDDDSDEPGMVLADERDDFPAAGATESWAALLPALDPTPMGWKQRAWYLGPHRGPLFDRNGNIGPTVWVDGRVVGGWGQQSDGSIVTRLLEPVTPADERRIAQAAERMQRFVGDRAVKPSFPTPLQRELAAASR